MSLAMGFSVREEKPSPTATAKLAGCTMPFGLVCFLVTVFLTQCLCEGDFYLHVYPLCSPRMLKHVSRASQQLARGLLRFPVPMTSRTFFFFFPFPGIILCWSGGMCFYSEHFVAGVYGLLRGSCYSSPAEMVQPGAPISGGLTERAYLCQILLWLGTWMPS